MWHDSTVLNNLHVFATSFSCTVYAMSLKVDFELSMHESGNASNTI